MNLKFEQIVEELLKGNKKLTHECECGCSKCGPSCACDKNCECKKERVSENEVEPRISVTLALNVNAVRMIEKLAEEDIKPLLEREINENTEAFCEMLGYDNW